MIFLCQVLLRTALTRAGLEEATKDSVPDGKEHPGYYNPAGQIGFIRHGDVVYFRNNRPKAISE